MTLLLYFIKVNLNLNLNALHTNIFFIHLSLVYTPHLFCLLFHSAPTLERLH